MWLSALIPGEKILDIDLSIVFRSNLTTPRVGWSKMKSVLIRTRQHHAGAFVVDEVISHVRVH